MLTAGVFYVSAFQTRLMEDNYVGTNLLSTIAVLKEVGFSDFSAEIDDDMTMLTVYTMLATSGVTLIFAVISFITLYLKKIPLAVKILGISAIFPAVSYIMLFIEVPRESWPVKTALKDLCSCPFTTKVASILRTMTVPKNLLFFFIWDTPPDNSI